MYFNSLQILELNEEGACKFLELKIKENNYLDYKSNLDKQDRTKRELLKDIIAFANANGGTIVIGVDEPNDSRDIDAQVIGLQDAEEWAQVLERIANSMIDPRISGLKFKVVKFKGGREILFLHIPPSLNRPHLFTFEKHSYFYMRHFESSIPMNIHEIRSSVMESYLSEERVQKYLEDKEQEIKGSVEYIKQPLFLFQLAPLISLESNLDVFNKKLESIFIERAYSENFTLFAGEGLKPTLYGISVQDALTEPMWKMEIYKRGYISLWYKNEFKWSNNFNSKDEFYIVHAGFIKLFNLFFGKVNEVMSIFNIDVPYIVRCRYYGANQTKLYMNSYRMKTSKYYDQLDISFPDHIRNTGESFLSIGEDICLELFNAYGFRDIID